MHGDDPKIASDEGGKAAKRTPHTIRFLDAEWKRIEAFADGRGLSGPEFVRFAALAAMEDGPSAAGRLAPLIERTFRYCHVIATKMRGDMLAAGQDEQMDDLIRTARALQDELLGDGKEG